MTIALFASELIPLQLIVSGLADEGLEVQAFDWNIVRGLRGLGPEISKGVLIVSKSGASEATDWVSRLLTRERPLILCAPQPDNEGSQLLKELGATEIITPRTWESRHIVERILGQLIVEGEIRPSACGNLYGATGTMRQLYRGMNVLAPLADPVLILGETGTGKELVAREIHNLSRRPDKFLPINCGELSLELTDRDLFGHKKGSFAGATEARRGLLAKAGRGTIFLDEIGELDLKAQTILLRVLEEKKVRRLGSNQTEEVLARIVLATNRDLEMECEAGRFRQDFFERIRGFTLELPPLRERRADIPLLVCRFLTQFNQETNRAVRLPDGAVDYFFNYEWVGNIRELRAMVRKAAAYADSQGIISISNIISYQAKTSSKVFHEQNEDSPKLSTSVVPNIVNSIHDPSKAVRRLQVFLCHSSGDKQKVRNLYHSFHADGIAPWLDEKNLLPGQEWEREISIAVRNSDIVIVCLSQAAITKSGYVQKEIKHALDVADEQPEGTIFLIPLKLEECDMPERLRRWHWVNLFEDGGYEKLMRALQARANQLGITI